MRSRQSGVRYVAGEGEIDRLLGERLAWPSRSVSTRAWWRCGILLAGRWVAGQTFLKGLPRCFPAVFSADIRPAPQAMPHRPVSNHDHHQTEPDNWVLRAPIPTFKFLAYHRPPLQRFGRPQLLAADPTPRKGPKCSGWSLIENEPEHNRDQRYQQYNHLPNMIEHFDQIAQRRLGLAKGRIVRRVGQLILLPLWIR